MENISKLEVKTCHKQKQLLAWERRRDESVFHRENRRKLGLLISTTIETFLREGFRWNITQDNSNEDIYGLQKDLKNELKMMGLKYVIPDTLWIMKHEGKFPRMT